MKTKSKVKDGVGVISLSGKMMGGPEMDDVRDEVRAFLGENIKNMVIDLKKVNWINSLGVGAIMSAYTTAMNAGGEVRLCGLTEKVHSLMILTQLIKVFKTYESVNEAVASFKE